MYICMCMWQHNVDGKLPETAADWFVYMYIKKKKLTILNCWIIRVDELAFNELYTERRFT